MPIYRLWRIGFGENQTISRKDARDDEHAVVVFGELLGVTLTLEEGPTAPPYMMARIEKESSWTKKPDIAVYDIS